MNLTKAVFLDRDGVINSDEGHYYIYKPEDFNLNPDIPEALKMLTDAGYKLIIISNQSGIGKGIYTKQDADNINELIKLQLSKSSVAIEAFYFCPHHPDTSNCLCRKPDSLMIEKGLARFNIDPQQSFLIGDSKRDVEAAEKAGVKGILVSKNTSILPVVKKIIPSSKF